MKKIVFLNFVVLHNSENNGFYLKHYQYNIIDQFAEFYRASNAYLALYRYSCLRYIYIFYFRIYTIQVHAYKLSYTN